MSWPLLALAAVADAATVLAFAFAVWVFIAKGRELAQVVEALRTYSVQLTLTELYSKLDRLLESPTTSGERQAQACDVLSEIVGQLQGNRCLRRHCAAEIAKASRIVSRPAELTESKKRLIGHQLREKLREYGREAWLSPKENSSGHE